MGIDAYFPWNLFALKMWWRNSVQKAAYTQKQLELQLLRSSMSINFLRRGKDLVMTIIKLKRLTIVVYHKSIVKNCQQISWTLKPTMVTKMLRRSLHWKYCWSSVFPYFFASQAPLKVAHSLLCSHFVTHMVLNKREDFFLRTVSIFSSLTSVPYICEMYELMCV